MMDGHSVLTHSLRGAGPGCRSLLRVRYALCTVSWCQDETLSLTPPAPI